MTNLTIEGELELIKKKPPAEPQPAPAPAAPGAMATLSQAWQSATKPVEDAPAPAATTEADPFDDTTSPPLERGENSWPKGDVGMWDVAGAAWTRDTITGDVNNYADGRRTDLALEIFNRLPNDAQERISAPEWPDFNRRRQLQTWEQKVLAEAALMAGKGPNAMEGLPLSQEEFDARLKVEDLAALEEANAILDLPGGVMAEFAGSIARDFTRPANLALMPLGLGAGSLAKVILSEALLSGASSVLALPGQYAAADRLDLPDPDPVMQVATDTAVGGLFAGVLGGIGYGVNWALGRNRASINARPEGANATEFNAAVDAAEAELTGEQTLQERLGKKGETTFDWDGHRTQGGLREDAISGLTPQFRTSLEGFIASAPPEIRSGLSVFSGYRSIERQQELWDASDKSGKMVARPGHSQHNHGQAVDLEWNGERLDRAPAEVQNWVAANLEKFGLTRPMDYEPWHIEPVGARGGGAGAGAGPTAALPNTEGLDYNEEATLAAIIGNESSGNSSAKADTSSATGLGQFVAGTWLEMVKKHRPDLLDGRTANEVLALREDGKINAEMTRLYMRDNHAFLKERGIKAGPTEIYLAHFMGPGGAVKALQAPLDTPISQLMSPKEITANASIRFNGKAFKDFTAYDLRMWSQAKMRRASGGGGSDVPAMGDTSRGYTGQGQVAVGDDTRIDVDYEVVDYASLIRASGDLQPRDRSRINSDDWIAATAARLDPAQLMPSPTADRGTPIVGPDGIIESGNGRSMAIARAYERHPDRAQAYKGAIEAAGYTIPEGVDRPVLIARRRTELTPDQRRRLVIDAQDSGVAQMTPTEVARSTAQGMNASILSRLDPSQPIGSDANGAFVRAALGTLPRSARNAMFDPNGALNALGQRQLREAIFARAWADPDILARYTEGAPAELKSLMEALEQSAPSFAALKADIEAGLVAPEMDISGYVLDAMRLIGAARDTAGRMGTPVAKVVQEMLDAINLFEGPVAPLTAALVRKMWRGGRAAPAEEVGGFLTRYADEARKAGASGGMFDAPSPREVLRTIDPETFKDLPEDLGKARGFATRGAPPEIRALPGEQFVQGARSPEVEAVHAEIAANLRVPEGARQLRTTDVPAASASPRVPDATGPAKNTPSSRPAQDPTAPAPPAGREAAMDTPAPMAPAATPDIPLSRPALARSDEGQGLALDKNPDLEAATARNFDAQASISKARAAGTFDIEMPDGTTWSAEEILAELDADARTDFQITFCTTNSGGAA